MGDRRPGLLISARTICTQTGQCYYCQYNNRVMNESIRTAQFDTTSQGAGGRAHQSRPKGLEACNARIDTQRNATQHTLNTTYALTYTTQAKKKRLSLCRWVNKPRSGAQTRRKWRRQ